jgi:hypothetical protein
MRKFLPLAVILVLWAASVSASGMPPYAESYMPNAFLSTLTSGLPSGTADNGIEIYPNPVTNGQLTVKSEETFTSIQIMNITGEIVFSRQYPSGSNAEVIELEKLGRGMYLIRIGFPEKENHTEKIMIK